MLIRPARSIDAKASDDTNNFTSIYLRPLVVYELQARRPSVWITAYPGNFSEWIDTLAGNKEYVTGVSHWNGHKEF